jgi:hypothetical protein
MLPFSAACERNKDPVREELRALVIIETAPLGWGASPSRCSSPVASAPGFLMQAGSSLWPWIRPFRGP